jgi:hypothetical protein
VSWQLDTPIGQRHLELEVAYCVGGVLSPLLANIALSVLDEHIVERGQANAPSWMRERRRRQGCPTTGSCGMRTIVRHER